MLQQIKNLLSGLLQKHRQNRQVHAREFRKIAREMAYLSDIAIRIGPDQSQTTEKLKSINKEMNRLINLVDSKDFARITPESRMELRESILASRKQLVETLHRAPTPTDTLQ